ncbi:MAG TPA: M48 family peptidase [Aquificales bacterium]|nr:M48 family peptidase [Aquificales bacterium]
MGKKYLISLLGVLASLLLLSCAERPVIHEHAFILLTHYQEMSLGDEAAREILKKEKLVKNPKIVKKVERIFNRLIKALPPKFQKLYDWKVYVIDKDIINAFALPNGNIFVYKGLIDFVKNDDQLAAVLGHEIAHVILRHGAEKVSQALLAQLGGYILLSKVSPAERELAAKLYNLGINVAFLLPYSRKQEKEADIVGILIMMRAGYNPDEAIKLWKKMAEKFEKKEPPEWLSDHPISKHRLDYIKKVVEFLKKHPQYVEKFEIPQKLLEVD